ncbi:MAG: hypothetical protein J6W35_03680 [Eubacterium sp.]|nr:hypothetical protein [Eubacterium sp.]
MIKMNEEYNFDKIDEHKVSQNMIELFEELRVRRDKYKKYGPLFILISGVFFLTLMFSLESKVFFLILWVISVIYCAALMIRSEYRYHQCAKLLGLIDEEEQGEEDEEDI